MESVRYGECLKCHSNLGGKSDGCQEFVNQGGITCFVCSCEKGYHRKVVVAYTKCQRNWDRKIPGSVDGCQEFTPSGTGEEARLTCAICGCHRGFHLKEIVN